MESIPSLADQGYMIVVQNSRPDRIFVGKRSEYNRQTDEWTFEHVFVITGYTRNGVVGLASDGPKNGTLHGNGDVAMLIHCLQIAHCFRLSEKWRPFYDKLFERLSR